MHLATTRFGGLEIEPSDILLFPSGVVGFEECRNWVLLGDAENTSVGWLQSVTRPEIALAVVSPRKFVPGYQVRVARTQLAPLQLRATHEAYVLAVVGKGGQGLTLNLKAPIIINLDRRLGRQVVATDDQPLRHELPGSSAHLRKTA